MLTKAHKIVKALMERERFECEYRCGREFGCHCEHKMQCMEAIAWLARKDVEYGDNSK